MFNDNRSRKVILVSHCILNQNSISDGTADYPAQFDEIVKLLTDNNIGIMQLPCPELLCLGLDRGDKNGGSRELLQENSRIRILLEKEYNLRRLHEIVRPIVCQVKEYLKYEFTIIGLIGINRSPSCGVETTSAVNQEVGRKGVFINMLLEELKREGIIIKSIGVKTSKIDESVTNIKQFINYE